MFINFRRKSAGNCHGIFSENSSDSVWKFSAKNLKRRVVLQYCFKREFSSNLYQTSKFPIH